jgi:hypothetical protein
VNKLDYLPPLPLFVEYRHTRHDATILTEQDELGIYHAVRLHDRARHIDLDPPPSILHKVLVLMDKHFPILEHLSLSFAAEASNTFALPEAFLAPDLRYLALPSVSPPELSQFLTTTVSLVTLKLSNIQTSSYFRPSLLVARLRSLHQLKELFIEFSVPISHSGTENELLVEEGTPVTLPSLKKLRFDGVGTFLESLVAQIRVPLLEQLHITLFNQIAFALPHLYHLINITEVFKLPTAMADFDYDEVIVTTSYTTVPWPEGPFRLRVKCRQLGWQIDCAAQICNALIPALSSVERLTLCCGCWGIATELQNGTIDGTTWHDLIRPFIQVKVLVVNSELSEDLSRALQVNEVGSDPGFLPNLREIIAAHNVFTSFIYARRVVGRPVKLSLWEQTSF